MNSPSIRFCELASRRDFDDVTSAGDDICIRILHRKRCTLIDGDWFRTCWQLAPAAYEAIAACCGGGAFGCGGGKACIVIKARPERADEIRDCLTRVLSDPRSWHRLDAKQREFVPLQQETEHVQQQ
jgi:hypothetical protein